MTYPARPHARNSRRIAFCTLLPLLLSACSTTKHLAEDELLLNKIKITSDSKYVKPGDFRSQVRQEANARWFNLSRVPLAIYNISGKDSTKRVNRFFRRIGEAPVAYRQDLTDNTVESLHAALYNRGYLHAKVKADTIVKKRKVNLTYHLKPGRRSYIRDIRYHFDDPHIRQAVMADSAATKLYKGAPLQTAILQAERNRIIETLRNKGYYKLNKEYVSFRADTALLEDGVVLNLFFERPVNADSLKDYLPHTLRSVSVEEDVEQRQQADSITGYRGLNFFFPGKINIQKRVYNSHIHIHKDSLFHENDIDNTYAALNGLSAVNYSTIRFTEADTAAPLLDCDIRVKTNKPHSVSAELEGTNTSGDLGAAVALTYTNRNLFHGSESFSFKMRGAYEAITGLEGYSNENYIEYSTEIALRFPTFIFPWITGRARKNLKSSSELTFMYDSQNRPEFHRRVVTGNWGYKWQQNRNPRLQHRFDLLSINYVFMPWISETFRKEYLEGDDPRYAMLRSSYENLLIMKMGYALSYNSLRSGSPAGLLQTNGYQIRLNVETAGNLLRGFSAMVNAKKHEDGRYNFFNIAYSQYAKFDFDFAKSCLINERNSIAFHTAFGIAIPYGNSDIIPYDKRYFSGGANSVRGWSVRELGPGKYTCKDGKIDFINQTGNLKLDLSMEYRTQLFSKFHGAFFVDAGNIWNTRNYASQPGGQFRFDRFYKQIAVAYGLGLRLNLDYFILRLDGGMKAINPSRTGHGGKFPISHPSFRRDFTLHFAVGMPF